MTKNNYIRTWESFRRIEDCNAKERVYEYCCTKAKKSGITCVRSSNDTLVLFGTKWQFIKYYIKTILYWTSLKEGFSRLFEVIFTW